MATILQIQNLTKYYRHQWTYRRILTLNNLNLSIDEGEIFGIIGHNGAGKTTMFKLLLGRLRPSAGTVTFDGGPLTPEARACIGFLPEHPYFYDYLTVQETLDFYARLYGMHRTARQERIAEIVEQVQLGPKLRASLRTLSKGTLQRVGIAQAIMNRPRLVILDEPMSGLDPAGRHHMREIIQSLQHAGTTVIFSSHVLPDTEALCNRVGIIAAGHLREVVVLDHAQAPEGYMMAVTGVESQTLETLEKIANQPPRAHGDNWVLRLPTSTAVRAALDAVRRDNGLVESLTPLQPSLEERFLACAGHASDLD
jgi:ABC-2 type transport system ATP-binding protein